MRFALTIMYFVLVSCASSEDTASKADIRAKMTAANFSVQYEQKEKKPLNPAGVPFYFKDCDRSWLPFFTKTEFSCSMTSF
jgi:hypothetical protein